MNNEYHILWIDDEWETQTSFITKCKLRYNMVLTPFKTQKEGLDAYAQNPAFWEAIILDAKVLDESEHEVARIGSLYKAVARLQSEFKDIPYFVSTGQPDLTKADHFEEFCKTTYSHRYYEKGVDDELLCQEIIKAVDEKSQRKIKNKYPEIFSWLPSELYGELLDILTIVENGENNNTNIFNNIRKILDWVMKELNKHGILAIEFSGTNLNDCSRFLANNELQEYVPQYMQRQIHSCCTIANEGSHRLISDEDVRNGIAPFLTRSTVFELLNILIWFHQLPSDDDTRRKITNTAVNCASKFKKEEPLVKDGPMVPEYDEELQVWHCGDTIIKISHWENGQITLKDKTANTNPKSKNKYPFFAHFNVIE